jgi:cbb3-type cytochrome c oxidase subunit III
LAVASLAAGLAAAGCGSVAADVEQVGSPASGKPLFVQHCGTCHTLADAGSKGVIGPNLDEAFGNVRKQGYAETTIRDVVRGQIAYPTSEPVTGEPGMPANLVKGDDAADVAAYVASVAGLPVKGGGGGQAAPPSDPKQTFIQTCGGCHTLADAGTSGNVGPNLDQLKPSDAVVQHQVEVGGGVMPAFKGKLSDAQIKAVAQFVSSSAGK